MRHNHLIAINDFHRTPESPCETANDGLGCGMIDVCRDKKLACFDYFAYSRTVEFSASNGVYYPEPRRMPTQQIYALMFNDGVKPMSMSKTKRLHLEKYAELQNGAIIG